MTRYCIICGHMFEAERKNTFKCSGCKAKSYSALGGYVRYCVSCGKPFKVRSTRRYYCSDTRIYKNGESTVRVCGEVKNVEKYAEKMTVKPKKKLSITDVQRMAAKEHLTYGEYVTKYGLE